MSRILFVVFVLASAAWADDIRFGGPLLGHMFDTTSQNIRPLVGAPGAAVVAAAFNGVRYEKAMVAGDGSIAIGYEAGAERLVWIDPRNAEARPSAIPESLTSFDSVALSSGAMSAINYSHLCNCVQILTDLRSNPKVQRTVTLPEGSSVQALAIPDDASMFVVGDASGKLLFYAPELTNELSLSTTALAFSPDGSTMAVVDKTRKTVAVLSNLKATPELIEVASERDGLKQPTAVAFVTPSKLLVADKESLVHIIDVGLGSVESIACACAPALVERTVDADIFRITGSDSGAVWVLQFVDDQIRTMFIPVQRDTAEGTR